MDDSWEPEENLANATDILNQYKRLQKLPIKKKGD
jgi:hypothetical protein